MRQVEVVIIGAAHAGLSTSYYLTRAGIEQVVLERGRVGEKWRTTCWDSFYLNTPNWGCSLPGNAYDGGDPDGFLSRAEAVTFLEEYTRSYNAPVHGGVHVFSVERAGDQYIVETDSETYRAEAVVVASGFFARPKIPASAPALAPAIVHVHSSEYTNPNALPSGAVLVVGSAQSPPLFGKGWSMVGTPNRGLRCPGRTAVVS
jgi:putative flavoprotein involved in K+ transport